MTRRLIIRAEAEADISDAAFWYESQQRGLASSFFENFARPLIVPLPIPANIDVYGASLKFVAC